MTQVVFENENGKIRFSGSGNAVFRMTEISGLWMSPKSFETVVYAHTAGQKTMGEQRQARVITIAGDICSGTTPVTKQIAHAVRVFDAPGWLTVYQGLRTRRIRAHCASFEPGQRHGPFRRFVLQLNCDCPYFEEVSETKVALFQREKELKTPFVLPCAFSRRTSSGVVVNRGDVESEPILEIYISKETTQQELWGLTLHNERTGETLLLHLPVVGGDCVTVDIEKRKIYNQRGENLISALSEDSFLSKFVLCRGANPITVISEQPNGINVLCRYSNRYLEAVC